MLMLLLMLMVKSLQAKLAAFQEHLEAVRKERLEERRRKRYQERKEKARIEKEEARARALEEKRRQGCLFVLRVTMMIVNL